MPPARSRASSRSSPCTTRSRRPRQNYLEPDPEIDLDIVHGASREMQIRYAMSDNIGLGGHNGAVIFKRYAGD